MNASPIPEVSVIRSHGVVPRRRAPVISLVLAAIVALPLATTNARAADPTSDVDLSPPGPTATVTKVPAPAIPPEAGPSAVHPNPRVKLSYRTFSISNVDETSVPLSGYQLDVFPLSRRFFRVGVSVLAGKGHAEVQDSPVTLRYGLAGVTGGFQLPARVTPFVEGTVMGGVLSGTLDRAVAIPGTAASIDVASGATGIYGRGIDFGAEFYTVGRLFLSGSIGWLRTTWLGPDVAALSKPSATGLVTKALTTDGLSLKFGIGF